jgi:spectrin beta
MFLLNKTNNDWWNVRQANGRDGFVPANYVKEIEPKVVQVQARKPETVRDIKRVKKTKMVLQNVMVKKTKSPRPTSKEYLRLHNAHYTCYYSYLNAIDVFQ